LDKIRLGIIGSGGIFRHLHVPYLEQSDLCEVAVIADPNQEAANELAEKLNVDVVSHWEKVIERNDLDAVTIATHPRPRCEIAVAAAETGKHLFVEKPMCCSKAEGDAMVDAVEKAGVKLQVAYLERWNPYLNKLKELLDQGDLGQPLLVHANQVGWFAPNHPWLFVQEESGGMLIEQAIHTIDRWLWHFGDVDSVYGRTSQVDVGGTYPGLEKGVHNNAVFIASFKNGMTGTLSKSWASEMRFGGEGMVGSKGSAEYGTDHLRWKTHDMEQQEEFEASVPDDDSYRNLPPNSRQQNYWPIYSKGACIENWLRAVRGEEEVTADARIGRRGVEIAEAIYRSAKTGEVVELSE